MNQTNSNEPLLNSTEILIRLYQKRKLLIIIFILAIVSSIFFTSPLFINPLFKSSAIIYPVNSGSISGALLGDKQGRDNLRFGDEVESEQLMQLLNSSLIRDHVVNKFKLLNHYKIDTTMRFAKTKLYNEFKKKFRFSRTEYMAVQIQVLDRDPVLAAEMANDIIKLLDTVKTNIQRLRAIEGLKIIEEEYNNLQQEFQLMEDSMTILRKMGVHDYESQAEMINQQLAIELGEGNQAAVKRLEGRLEVLAKYGGPYVSLRDKLNYEQQRLSVIKEKYQEAKMDASKLLPQSFVISEAFVAERKSYPLRSVLVIAITASALFFSILLIFFFENLTKIREKIVK
ncbi:MAG: hypothetical protein KKG99_04510 [Bacteroidetes bacterium]|nr:hypothetical protein [Bacteroidota bacterium]